MFLRKNFDLCSKAEISDKKYPRLNQTINLHNANLLNFHDSNIF